MTKKNTDKNEIKETNKIKKINKKLKSTQKDLEKQIVDLTKQIKILTKKSDKSASKLLKKLEANFNKKAEKLQADFDKRVADLSKNEKSVIQPRKTAVKSPAAAKPRVSVATKPKVAKVAVKATSKPGVGSLTGVGPMTQKKLAAVGITSLEQIATPSAAVSTKLKEFERVRGYNTWQAQAKKLLA